MIYLKIVFAGRKINLIGDMDHQCEEANDKNIKSNNVSKAFDALFRGIVMLL